MYERHHYVRLPLPDSLQTEAPANLHSGQVLFYSFPLREQISLCQLLTPPHLHQPGPGRAGRSIAEAPTGTRPAPKWERSQGHTSPAVYGIHSQEDPVQSTHPKVTQNGHRVFFTRRDGVTRQ